AYRRDVAQPYRRAVAVSDDERAVLRRVGGAVIDIDLIAPLRVIERALGSVGVGRRDGRAYILEPDAVLEERLRIEVDAHRRQRAAAERDIADTLDLQQLLLDDRRGGIVEISDGQRIGGQRQDEDGRIRGIEGVISRI